MAGELAHGQEQLEGEVRAWRATAVCPAHLVARFTHNLGVLFSNGIPIVRALETLAHQEEGPNLGVVIQEMTREIESGRCLSDAARTFPRVFPPLWVAMVEVGEQTGQLTTTLNCLSDWMARDDKTFRKVKSALAYPTFVCLSASILMMAIFYGVMPQFVEIFQSMHIELPALTRAMIVFTSLLQNPGTWVVLAVLLVFVWQGLKIQMSTLEGRVKIYRFLNTVPLLSRILLCAGHTRMALAARISLESGVDVVTSMKLALQASQHPLMEADLDSIVESISRGDSLSEHMRSNPEIYDLVLAQLLAAGEQAASISEMLSFSSEMYARELEDRIDSLTAALEPILLFVVSVVVGIVLLSVFLPMNSYMAQLKI